jgi:lysophospholipase L1-like esterase
VLAFGDSITNGGGELQWGVALHSWALWLARGLGLPYTSYAEDGARAPDIVERQIAAHRAAQPDARYDVGCVYIGTNDVRALDWDPDGFARDFSAALAYLRERCDRTLAVTIPLDLGRPRAGAKVEEANRAIERATAGTLVVDLRRFGGRRLMMADHVHPTAFGQIAIAERALAILAADGLPARAWPSRMISYETTWWGRLRGDATYAYRHTKASVRAVALKTWMRAAGRLPR